jgi:hypothetical protein
MHHSLVLAPCSETFSGNRLTGVTAHAHALCAVAVAGLCKAILPALKCHIKGTQTSMFNMLSYFAMFLSDDSAPAALAVLLNGGVLELTMAHMANAGPEEVQAAQVLFIWFSNHPFGLERMSKKGMVDQLTQWVAKWLLRCGVSFRTMSAARE